MAYLMGLIISLIELVNLGHGLVNSAPPTDSAAAAATTWPKHDTRLVTCPVPSVPSPPSCLPPPATPPLPSATHCGRNENRWRDQLTCPTTVQPGVSALSTGHFSLKVRISVTHIPHMRLTKQSD